MKNKTSQQLLTINRCGIAVVVLINGPRGDLTGPCTPLWLKLPPTSPSPPNPHWKHRQHVLTHHMVTTDPSFITMIKQAHCWPSTEVVSRQQKELWISCWNYCSLWWEFTHHNFSQHCLSYYTHWYQFIRTKRLPLSSELYLFCDISPHRKYLIEKYCTYEKPVKELVEWSMSNVTKMHKVTTQP